MTATTTFFAYRINQDGGRHFFEWNKCDTWNSREDVEKAIAAWKKSVPENYAARVRFEIHEDTN